MSQPVPYRPDEAYHPARIADSAAFFPDLASWRRDQNQALVFETAVSGQDLYYQISKADGGFEWEWGYPGEDYIDRSKARFATEQEALRRPA